MRDKYNPFDLPNIEFINNFRITKLMMNNLINSIKDYVIPGIRKTKIPFHLKVFVTVYFLSHGSYQRPSGSCAFLSMSQSMVSDAIAEVTTLITRHLMPIYIRFPATNDEKNVAKQTFYQKFNMRGIIGAIDGTHVDIIAPPANDVDHPPHVYINRKGKHSINVMLICDANSKIIAANARYPGSCHDSAIWQVSDIRNHLRTAFENGDRSSYLIGDSGYPLEPWLFTPYLNVQENTPQSRYNEIHKSTRNVIERTNGICKARFRCLLKHRCLHYHPGRAAYIIYACTVLHNMCIDAGLDFDDEIIDDNEDGDNEALNVGEHMNQTSRNIRENYVLQNF